MIRHGTVPIFVRLLSSQNDNVRDQSVWALGNIAGESPKYRDMVLKEGALPPLLTQLRQLRQLPKNSKLSMLRNATWTLSTFCRGKPLPPHHLVRSALPELAELVRGEDERVLSAACWALSYLSDESDLGVGAVINSGAIPRLVALLGHSSTTVAIPALRTLGKRRHGRRDPNAVRARQRRAAGAAATALPPRPACPQDGGVGGVERVRGHR